MSPLAIRDSSGSVEFGLQRVRARPVNNRQWSGRDTFPSNFGRAAVERWPFRDCATELSAENMVK